MKPWSLTPEIKAAILADYASGEKIRVISAKFGCHESYPAVIAKRLGIARRPKTRQRP